MLQYMRRRVFDLATKTAIRHAAGPVYAGLVAAQIQVLQSRARPRPAVRGVTALIKTFERPVICSRLLRSIRRYYSELPVVIVDDSRQKGTWPGAHLVAMPYDVGLSAGRNEGLKHVDTDLFILLDDDFIFYEHTDLARPVQFLRDHPDADLVAGQVVNLPFFDHDVSVHNRNLFGGARRTIGRLPVYDRVACFFVGRTKRIAEVGWDPRLKLCEHTEFFWRARGRLTSVFDERFRILHAKTPFDEKYMQKRNDVQPYLDLLRTLLR